MRQGVRDNKIVEVPDEETDFEMPNRFFSSHINLIPMHNAVQGPRLFYGARFMNQAMPVKDPEAPWVQNVSEDGVRSYDELMGAHAGAIRADKAGEVTEVTPDHIKWKGEDGVEGKTPLYNSFYYNRKSTINSTPTVAVGDKLSPGQLLAHSNFTDTDGTLALGKNARVALVPFNGFSMDDAMVISEDFARKLTIDQTHHHQVDYERGIKGGLHHFVSLFPSKFTKDQTKLLDEDGVIKQGSIVQKGDPLLLATKPKTITSALQLGKLSKTAREARGDISEIWDEDEPGTVTDVVKTKDGAQVFVQAFHPAKLGSKCVLRSGQKGVISKILPTDQVPRTADGRPVDVLLNHLGIPSRVNSSLPYEILLGKLGELNGKPYKIPAFNKKGEKWYDFVQSELDKHGLKDAEDLYDPTTNEKLENPVTVGNGYVLALHHTGKSKFSARGQGGYDMQEQPAKGGGEGAQAKRLSGLESTALMASGAYNILREGATLRGAKNDNYWRSLRSGYKPVMPGQPFVVSKFHALLNGAGFKARSTDKGKLRLGAFTDKDLATNKATEIRNGEMVDLYNELKPVEGGLFDEKLVGGNGWGYINLPHQLPNPAMEKTTRQLLGLTEKQLRAIIAGEMELPSHLRQK